MSTNIEKEVREYVKKEYLEDNISWEIVNYDEWADPIYSLRIGKEKFINAIVQFNTHQGGESYSLYDDVYNEEGAVHDAILAGLLKTYEHGNLDITKMVAAEIVWQIEDEAEHDSAVYTQRCMYLAREGELPDGFYQWDLANNNGFTVAHEAAFSGYLPCDFDQWDMTNNSGWTVAHMAAEGGNLPCDFDQWKLTTYSGWTVAHSAAESGHLPCDFDQWGLIDNTGTTVADVNILREKRQQDRILEVFDGAEAEQNSELM
jgi:hypothetical protein